MKRTGRLSWLVALALMSIATSSRAQNEVIKGEVKKIDDSAGKITLTSGPIKSLDMDEPNMTMVYRVQDPAMLKQVKVGDKVLFEVKETTAGITVTKMEKSK